MKTLNLTLAATLLLGSALPALSHAIHLDDYPLSRSILLGKAPARVTPLQEFLIKAPESGELTLYLQARTQMVAAETAIAGLEIERLELERKILDLTKRLLYEKELPEWTMQNEKTISTVDTEITQVRSQSALLEKLKENPDLSDAFLESSNLPVSEPTATGEQIDSLLERNEARLALLLKYRELLLSQDYSALEKELKISKLEQQEYNYEKRLEAASMHAPFSGEVQFLLPLSKGQTTVLVQSNEEIALLRDLTEIRADASVPVEAWRLLPVGSLTLQLGPPQDGLIARYVSSSVKQIGGKEQLVYSFVFSERVRRAAQAYLGGIVNADLYYSVPQDAHFVPKLELILADPEAFRRGGWPASVEAAFPGHAMLAAGQDHIAVAAEKE